MTMTLQVIRSVKLKRKEPQLNTYDGLNRLSSVTEPVVVNNVATSKTTSYTYDGAGNRKSEKVQIDNKFMMTLYAYDALNRLNTTLSSSGDETTYIYDNNGNLISRSICTSVLKTFEEAETATEENGQAVLPNFDLTIRRNSNNGTGTKSLTQYSYDTFNRLTTMKDEDSSATYKYNPQGYRVEKTVNGQTALYLYEGNKVVLETDKNNNQKAIQVYGINLIYRSAVKDANTEKYYYLYNAHGDVTSLINPNGIVAATYDYDAFGNVISKTGNANNSILFAGYQHDDESGLYYLNARYYDSVTSRFITEDTYTGEKNDPLTLNLYTYCLNNPIVYLDPSGHEAQTQEEIDAEGKYGQASYYYAATVNEANYLQKNDEYHAFCDADPGIRALLDARKPTSKVKSNTAGSSITSFSTSTSITKGSRLYDILAKIKRLEELSKLYNKGVSNDFEILWFMQMSNYSDLKWELICEGENAGFISYVNIMDSSLLDFFSPNGKGALLNDPITGNDIDFIHMMATLNGSLSGGYRQDLAGWAGDLQQTIYDLQNKSVDCIFDVEEGVRDYNQDELYAKASKIIGAKNVEKQPYQTFTLADMIADIDAYNLAEIRVGEDLWHPTSSLSSIIQNYYTNDASKRYTHFVNNIGGMEILQNKTDSYTYDAYNSHNVEKYLILENNKRRKISYFEFQAMNKAFMDYIYTQVKNEK